MREPNGRAFEYDGHGGDEDGGLEKKVVERGAPLEANCCHNRVMRELGLNVGRFRQARLMDAL